MSFEDFDDFGAEEELEEQNETQWTLFELGDRWFAISIEKVRELIMAPQIIELPDSPPYVLGLIKLRELTIPVIDLKVRLGMPSSLAARENLVRTLDARRQDHTVWKEELKGAVRENRQFGGQTDPEKCEFGAWLAGFKTSDLVLSGLRKKLDATHRAIHKAAETVNRLVKEGNAASAEDVIRRIESRDLKRLDELCGSIIEEMGKTSREVILVADIGDHGVGMLVDRVESVITLIPAEIGPPPKITSSVSSGRIMGVARPKGQDRMILLLNPDHLVDSAEAGALLEEKP